MESPNEPKGPTVWERVTQHPVVLSFVAFFGIASGLVIFLNQLPDFFIKTLPWLGGQVNIAGLSINLQQLFAVLVLAAGFFLLVGIIWQTRRTAQRDAIDRLITWLYRRENWAGLSPEGRNSEPSPKAWAADYYRHLGLAGSYQPPHTVAGEPNFDGHGIPPPQTVQPSIPEHSTREPAVQRTQKTEVTTSFGADAVLEEEMPRFWKEMKVEQREVWREQLCPERAALIAEGHRLDDEVTKPGAERALKDEVAKWIGDVEGHAINRWRYTRPQYRNQLAQIKLKSSQLPYRSRIRQHIEWLEQHGRFCADLSGDDATADQPAPKPTPPIDLLKRLGTKPKSAEAEATDATPQRLWGLFTNRMEIEAEADVERYIGKRMTISGPLGDVSPSRVGGKVAFIQVTFALRAFENLVYLYFDGDWFDRLRVIGQGTQITVRGTIERLTRVDLQLKDCEIVRVGGP